MTKYLYGVETLPDLKKGLELRIKKSQELLKSLMDLPIEAQDDERILSVYRNLQLLKQVFDVENREEKC